VKKQVPTVVAAVIIIAILAAVAVVYVRSTGPRPLPPASRAAADRGPRMAGRGSAEQLIARFENMTNAEREKYRTGNPGQRAAWRRWAEAKGIPIPAEAPKGIEPKRPTQPEAGKRSSQ